MNIVFGSCDTLPRKTTTIGGIPSPVFYPSVSSVSKNVWSVVDHIELLVTSNHPQFLVSCFDVYKYKSDKKLKNALVKAKNQYQVILWDSGIYEVVWSKSKRWCKKRYMKTLKENHFNHALSFDDYCLKKQNTPIDHIFSSLNSTVNQVGKKAISPIVHCPDPNHYADICQQISLKYKPKIIAIPERELGQGVLEITGNISKIRNVLNSTGEYQPIHVLGTGNPISMMLYAFAGADSFDGLDWCQTVVDYETGTLHHPLQFDFYKYQSVWSGDSDMSFLARCYLHNLEFYKFWMERLKLAIENNEEERMMEKYLPSIFFNQYCIALSDTT